MNNAHFRLSFHRHARTRPLALDTVSKMVSKPVDPLQDRLSAENKAALHQKIVNGIGAKGDPIVSPNRVSDAVARRAIAFEARQCSQRYHDGALCCAAQVFH